MKTFQMNGKPEVIEFMNYDRISEKELFRQVFERLENLDEVTMGSKKIGPSEDIYECSFLGEPFTLFYDEDNGSSIYCDNLNTIHRLMKLLDTAVC